MNILENINEKIALLFKDKEKSLIKTRALLNRMFENEKTFYNVVEAKRNAELKRITTQQIAGALDPNLAFKEMQENERIYKKEEKIFFDKKLELVTDFQNNHESYIVLNSIVKDFKLNYQPHNFNFKEELYYKKDMTKESFRINFVTAINNNDLIIGATISMSSHNDLEVALDISGKIISLNLSGNHIHAGSGKSKDILFMNYLETVSIMELDKKEVKEMYSIIYDGKFDLDLELYKKMKSRIKEYNKIMNPEFEIKNNNSKQKKSNDIK